VELSSAVLAWLETLPWETFVVGAIASFIAGIALLLLSPRLPGAWGRYAERLLESLVLFVRPVAYGKPRIHLDRSSIVCRRHVETSGDVVGYSLRLSISVHNTDRGEVLIRRGRMRARLTSYDDPRRRITFEGHPFTGVLTLLGPGDLGAEIPPMRLGPKEKRILDIGLVTEYLIWAEDLPGERVDGYFVMGLELTPRPGRNVFRYPEALEPSQEFRFQFKASAVIEEADNWLEMRVALAREIGASEKDIEDRLLSRWRPPGPSGEGPRA
jgi:hypothetical protein